jgi:hypothetical protein
MMKLTPSAEEILSEMGFTKALTKKPRLAGLIKAKHVDWPSLEKSDQYLNGLDVWDVVLKKYKKVVFQPSAFDLSIRENQSLSSPTESTTPKSALQIDQVGTENKDMDEMDIDGHMETTTEFDSDVDAHKTPQRPSKPSMPLVFVHSITRMMPTKVDFRRFVIKFIGFGLKLSATMCDAPPRTFHLTGVGNILVCAFLSMVHRITFEQ